MKMDKLNTRSILLRVRAETPRFWKKIRTLMITCGVIGAGLEALPDKTIAWMPEDIPGMLIVTGVIGTALASMTVSDQKKSEEEKYQ